MPFSFSCSNDLLIASLKFFWNSSGLSVVPLAAWCGYKEFKIVTLYDQDQKHRYVRATRGNCSAAGKLMRRGVVELRVRAAVEKLAVADGAPWIWNQVERNASCMDAKVLDFYHLSEHVHAAKRVVFGEKSESGKTWVDRSLHLVRHEGYEAFWSKPAPASEARPNARRWTI